MKKVSKNKITNFLSSFMLSLISIFSRFIKDIRYRKYLIIISFFIAILIVVVFAVIMRSAKDSDVLSANEAARKIREEYRHSRNNFSRITFFHNFPIIGSLAVPSSWEGKYRLVEEGNQAKFIYIDEPERPMEIFSIVIMSESEIDKSLLRSDGISEISRSDGFVIYFIPASIADYEGANLEMLKKIHNEIYGMLESFKIIKI